MGKAFSNVKDGWDFDHVFTFGKYTGCLVDDIIEDDPGYILWMIGNTENMFTKAVIVDAIRQDFKIRNRAKAQKSYKHLDGEGTGGDPWNFDDVPF